jgi:hypothetical protein
MTEPKIKHSTLARDRRRLRLIVHAFAKKMVERAERFKVIDPEVFAPDSDVLLKYRKGLVQAVKSGMLERQDLELEIGISSALVWFMRLTKEEQDRVTDLW